ncbi:MAG: hypothetical protein II877_06015 [Synergistaceae bacterium]|nr:hypothetical protein [Synergistaceae bacterium]MBQ6970753.1 hypothetical protein [Synergistaceae bacterium]
MGWLFAFIAATVFLLGLWQWASGGALLWRIFRLKRGEKGMSRDEKKQAEREVKQLEQSADRTIGAAFRIVMGLAVFVWLVLGVTFVLDMFGINWMSALYSRAKSYWVAPGTQSQQSTQTRNDTLRNMGNSFRR